MNTTIANPTITTTIETPTPEAAPTDLASLAQRRAAAQTEVRTFEAELASIPSLIIEAADAADGPELVRLQARRIELPSLILTGKVLFLRLSKTFFGAQIPEAEARFQASGTALEKSKATLDTAQEAYTSDLYAFQDAHGARDELKREAANYERAVDDLLRQELPRPRLHSV